MTRPLGEMLDATQLADIERALRGIAERREQYEQARQYDSADLWEADQDSRQGQLLRQASLEYDVNYCAPVINAVSNGMTVDGITATQGDMDDAGQPVSDDQGTALVNEIWEAQKLGEFWPTWQRAGLRDGDAYLMLWPTPDAQITEVVGEDDNGRFVQRQIDPEQLNITYCDPLVGRLFYDEENPRIKLYYAYLWSVRAGSDKGVVWRLNIIYPEYIDQFMTAPTRSDKPKPQDFRPYEPDDFDTMAEGDQPSEGEFPGRRDNPFGIVPVWHLRTDVNYGQPVHMNAYAPQDAISEIIEKMLVTMNFQAWPQVWALQEAEKLANMMIREDPLSDEYDDGLGDFGDDLDRDSVSRDSDITNETGTDLTATPGGIMVLKGFKQVGQLQAADPSVFLDPWREFAKTASDTTDTPPWTFRAVGAEIPSGVALKIASAPQTAKRARCAALFGSQLGDMLAFAAEVCGRPDLTVKVKWAPFEIVDEVERWTLVKLRTDAGVPLDQALIMAGVPAPDARKWAEQKKADADQAFERQQVLASKQGPPDKPPVDE